MRDLVIHLAGAFRNRVLPAHFFVNKITQLAGPYFRYEEEALYRALHDDSLTEAQASRLLSNHDHAIIAIRQIMSLSNKNKLTDQEADDGAGCAQSLINELTECDGLSLMIERLPDQSILEVFNARRHASAAALDLLQWAGTIRPPRQWQVDASVVS